jgi:hypothetical protein
LIRLIRPGRYGPDNGLWDMFSPGTQSGSGAESFSDGHNRAGAFRARVQKRQFFNYRIGHRND